MPDVLAGTPLGDTIQAARRAMQLGDFDAAGSAYALALTRLPAGTRDTELRRALCCEHVGGLLGREQLRRAAAVAQDYVAQALAVGDESTEVVLLVLLGEAWAAQDNWKGCRHAVSRAQALLKTQPDRTAALGAQEPHLLRLIGLVAAEDGDHGSARSYLNDAGRRFTALGNAAGERAVGNDLRRLDLMNGSAAAVGEMLGVVDIRNTAEVLLYVWALRRDARYETAARLLERRLEFDLEPALRFPLLHELLLLYQTLSDHDKVERLLPLLDEAVQWASDPAEAEAAVQRLRAWRDQGFTVTQGATFDARLHSVRALIQQGKLEAAQVTLADLRHESRSPRLAAQWHLVAGELAIALGLQRPADAKYWADLAEDHLTSAAQLSHQLSVPQIYAQALHLRGRVFSDLRHDTQAARESWAEADSAEELIAGRQDTDEARVRYLEAIPTQYDEQIEAAAAKALAHEGAGRATILAAIEAARGAAILAHVLPADAVRLRELPTPTDAPACWRWCTAIAARLPRNLAIWLLHPTPKRLHHVLLGEGLLHWETINVDRNELGTALALADLSAAWETSNPAELAMLLEDQVRSVPDFLPSQYRRIAQMLDIDRVLSVLPRRITRLAVVPGYALGDIPFAALPLSDTAPPGTLLIQRYALSLLPCLSAVQPLADRSAGCRGDHGLLVSTLGDQKSLPPLMRSPMMRIVQGESATIDNVDQVLQASRFPLVRLDCHGVFSRHSAMESWLELAPPGPAGRLTAQRFQRFSLRGCGTLMLGACESGMTQRLGRDERLGFVRSGLAAGTAAVLAAGWVAADAVASIVLDRFQGYLRYLPRDQALQRAQLDVMENRCTDRLASIPQPGHPAWWSCWALHGDAGVQTRSSYPVRRIREWMARH